jgi:hypothetical protein
VRGRVVLTVLVVTACLYSLLGTIGPGALPLELLAERFDGLDQRCCHRGDIIGDVIGDTARRHRLCHPCRR